MNSNIKSSAELFVATGCSHCPVVLTELTEQLKKGQLSSLQVTNIAVDNDKAAELGIRSVPWFSLSNENSYMVFAGDHSPKEIKKWLATLHTKNAMLDYIEEYLTNGQLMSIAQAIQIKPEMFKHIINMLEDDETSMNIRIGLDALIENFSASNILRQHTAALKKIASSNNIRLQIDALHYIALTGDAENKVFLEGMTTHENKQVKDAANEAIETLNDLLD